MNPTTQRSFFVGAGTIAIVAVVGGVLFVQNRRNALDSLGKPRIAPARMPASFKMQKEQEALEKVKRLRELWRDKWAIPHKDLLVTMRTARPGDDSAWINVVNELPRYKQLADMGMAINTPEEQDSHNHGNPDYVVASWNPPWPVKPARPELAEQAKIVSEGHRITFQQDMAQWHDVKLTEVSSISANRECCLWASGRVTWRQDLPDKVGAESGATYVYPKEKEVLPPFDFLPQQ